MAIELDAAYVLAAGRGSRMGVPKALLLLDGSYLLHRVASAYLSFGVRAVHALVNDEVAHTLATASPLSGLVLHWGVDPNAAMMESVQRALRIAFTQGHRAFFLQPVDNGVPGSAVLRRLQNALGDHLVAKPCYRMKGGHPILLTRAALTRMPWKQTSSLRESLSSLNETELLRVEVDDPAVLRNWNTPEDFAS